MQVIINNILFLYFASLVLTQTWTTFESKTFSKLETFMVLPLTYSTAMLIISHRQKLQRFYIFFYILVNKAVSSASIGSKGTRMDFLFISNIFQCRFVP